MHPSTAAHDFAVEAAIYAMYLCDRNDPFAVHYLEAARDALREMNENMTIGPLDFIPGCVPERGNGREAYSIVREVALMVWRCLDVDVWLRERPWVKELRLTDYHKVTREPYPYVAFWDTRLDELAHHPYRGPQDF